MYTFSEKRWQTAISGLTVGNHGLVWLVFSSLILLVFFLSTRDKPTLKG